MPTLKKRISGHLGMPPIQVPSFQWRVYIYIYYIYIYIQIYLLSNIACSGKPKNISKYHINLVMCILYIYSSSYYTYICILLYLLMFSWSEILRVMLHIHTLSYVPEKGPWYMQISHKKDSRGPISCIPWYIWVNHNISLTWILRP